MSEQVERPTAITVICVLMAIGAVVTIPAVFATKGMFPAWYTGFVLASAAVGLVCLVGLWQMRKWAVFLYAGLTAVGQVVLLSSSLWAPMSIVIPAIVIAVMFANLGKMR